MPDASPLDDVRALTFDFFGTVLDLGGSLAPAIDGFLEQRGRPVGPAEFWDRWRYRQRIEQYQENITARGHRGYLAAVRRALIYSLRLYELPANDVDIDTLMAAWQQLKPYPDVAAALPRLAERFQLVGLSNGEPDFLDHLAANRIGWDFDRIISVQVVGAFKPHPGVYLKAAELLGLEPAACLMVSSNSFDVMGARMCGFRGAYVDRDGLPYEVTSFQPDLVVPDFSALADALLEESG